MVSATVQVSNSPERERRVHVVPRPELLSKEEHIGRMPRMGQWTILASTHSPAPFDQPTIQVALPVRACSPHCPIRGIRGIGSLIIRDRAPRGRAPARVIPEKGGVPCPFVGPFTYSSSTSRLLRSSRMQMRLRSDDQAAHRGEQT